MASLLRRMGPSRSALSHIERTAREPRQNALHQVVLSRIEQVNPKIRLLRLEIPDRGQITVFSPLAAKIFPSPRAPSSPAPPPL